MIEHRAPITWAEFGVACPGCGIAITTGEDWISTTYGDWSPGDEHRWQRCENDCDILVQLPDVRLVPTFVCVPLEA